MGNCFSAENAKLAPPKKWLTAAMIIQGFNCVAAILSSQNRHVDIVVAYGAVDALLFHTQQSILRVSFFYWTKAMHQDVRNVLFAADAASKTLQFDRHWLYNLGASSILPEVTIQQLYGEARRQNVVIFRARGLTVYAAPWRYALSAKLSYFTAPKTTAQSHDMGTAVRYLKRLVAKRGGRPVTKSEMVRWAKEFKFSVPSNNLMDALGRAYHYDGVGVMNG